MNLSARLQIVDEEGTVQSSAPFLFPLTMEQLASLEGIHSAFSPHKMIRQLVGRHLSLSDLPYELIRQLVRLIPKAQSILDGEAEAFAEKVKERSLYFEVCDRGFGLANSIIVRRIADDKRLGHFSAKGVNVPLVFCPDNEGFFEPNAGVCGEYLVELGSVAMASKRDGFSWDDYGKKTLPPEKVVEEKVVKKKKVVEEKVVEEKECPLPPVDPDLLSSEEYAEMMAKIKAHNEEYAKMLAKIKAHNEATLRGDGDGVLVSKVEESRHAWKPWRQSPARKQAASADPQQFD